MMAQNTGHDWDAIAETAQANGWGYKRVAREIRRGGGDCSDSNARRALKKRRCQWCKSLGKLGRECCPDAEAVSVAPDFPCDPRDAGKLVPEGIYVSKSTTQIGKTGEIERQWLMVKPEQEARIQALLKACERIAEPLRGQYDPTPEPYRAEGQKLYNFVPIGDAHFGMRAWPDETGGGPWDLGIAERVHVEAIQRLIAAAPQAAAFHLCSLGDFFHANDNTGQTPRSKHPLDTDGRYQKVLDVGIQTIRYCIEMALQKFPRVVVSIIPGNHDPEKSIALRYTLQAYFEREPRVTIDRSRTLATHFVWGNVLQAMAHGHTKRIADMSGVMPKLWREDWGRTKFHYWSTGHIHHDRMVELNDGSVAESMRTLAAPDSYAADHFFMSGRDIKLDVLHAEHGRIERHYLGVSQIESAQLPSGIAA